MPYIKSKDRKKFNKMCKYCPDISTKGELEFIIFWLMKQYMKNKEYRYSNLHDCVYASQHCADEFRRRFLDKREDEAIKENGDIN